MVSQESSIVSQLNSDQSVGQWTVSKAALNQYFMQRNLKQGSACRAVINGAVVTQ